ncbi:MAG: regulatory protein RecX [Eubacteriales bacterium]|nr:regulatory protein RecX [Eubacteriales bacterium]
MPVILEIKPKNKYSVIVNLDDDRFFKISNKVLRRLHYKEGDDVEDLSELETNIIHPAIRYRMKDLLLRCDYAVEELYRKIERAGYHRSFAKPVMNEFLAAGFVDDRRYGEALIENRSKRYGPMRIRQTLYQKGLDPVLIDELMAERPVDDDALIDKFLQKEDPLKLRTDMKLKQRVMRRLAGKGFRLEQILDGIQRRIGSGMD